MCSSSNWNGATSCEQIWNKAVYSAVLIHAFWCQIKCTTPWDISAFVKPQRPRCLRLCRVNIRHVAGEKYFLGSFHFASLSLSLWLSACLILKMELQTWIQFLGQGAPVVLWEGICALVLLLNPGYVNQQETTPTNNDSPKFNCITGLFQWGNQRWCVCVWKCVKAAMADSFPVHWNSIFGDCTSMVTHFLR